MKTRTPHHHCVRFFCHDNGCILMMLLFVLGYWSTESRGEQPKIRRASLAGITCNGQNTKPNTKEMPTQAQEDEAADPQLPGSGILSPATIISPPFGTSFQVNVSGGRRGRGGGEGGAPRAPPRPARSFLRPPTIMSAPFGTSFQVNVSGGQNMV